MSDKDLMLMNLLEKLIKIVETIFNNVDTPVDNYLAKEIDQIKSDFQGLANMSE